MININKVLSRFWKRVKLGFDRSISGSWGKQILWLLSFFLIFGGLFIVVNRMYPSDSRFDEWDIIGLFFGQDSNYLADNGNVYFGYLVVIIGAIIFNGLLISFFANIMQGKVNDFRKGHVKYSFDKHVVILGYNDMVPDIVKQLVKLYPKCDIAIQTTLDVENVRTKLYTKLDEKEERNIVIINNQRDSEEALTDIVVHKARKVYILGEDEDVDRDAISINCLKKIADICAKHNRTDRLQCVTLLQNQSSFVFFQTADITKDIKERIEFIPFNFDEVWARKVLVTGKSEINGVTYTPLDREGIAGDSEKYVHLVILGMTPMGLMLALEAAHVAHYPNFITKGKKTKITLVDIEARREMDFMTSCFNSFFDQCDYTYMEIEKGKVGFEERFKSITPTGSFLDIEFEFIQSNVADDMMRQKLSDWADDKEQILTIAVCFQKSARNIATALYMPDKVYENEIMLLVKQNTSGELLNLVRIDPSASDQRPGEYVKYRNIRPFGMNNDGYEVGERIENWAKNINYLYSYYYDNNKIPTDYPKDKIDMMWNDLSVSDKWSSMYNVLTIPGKMRSVGMDYQDKNVWRALKDDEIELLARVEHNRWNVERLLCGYRPTNEEETAKIKDDIDQKSNKKLKRYYKNRNIHYDIRPYDELCNDETGFNVRRFDVGVVEGMFDVVKNGE